MHTHSLTINSDSGRALRPWELALLLALAVTILWGAASLGQQEELGRKVIRLHVIANSDSPEDQALKLRVRDRVLARAQEILEQSADMAQAEQALTAALPELTTDIAFRFLLFEKL